MTFSIVQTKLAHAIRSSLSVADHAFKLARTIGMDWLETGEMVALAVLCSNSYALGNLWMAIKKPPDTAPRSQKSGTESSVVVKLNNPKWEGEVNCAVIIPVLVNKEHRLVQLEAAMSSVQKQLKPDELLIVIDDGSPFYWMQNIEVLCLTYKAVLVRHERNFGPARARNSGIRYCRDHFINFVCFLDSDCIADSPSWIRHHRKHQEKYPGIASGRTIAHKGNSMISRYHDLFGTLNGRRIIENGHPGSPIDTLLYGPTCNFSIYLPKLPLEFEFDEVNYCTAAFEDVDFCVRARKQFNISVLFVSEAQVHHDYAATVFGLVEQFWRYGKASFTMEKLHPEYNDWLSNSRSISNYDTTI